MYLTRSSEAEEDTVDSIESWTEFEEDLLKPSKSADRCSNCCTCNSTTRYRQKSRGQQSSSIGTYSSRANYRDRLMLKVLNEQVSQQESSEKKHLQENQVFRVNEATNILKTLLNSVHLTTTCLGRLTRLLFDDSSEFERRCEGICRHINGALERTREPNDKHADNSSDLVPTKSTLTKPSSNFVDLLRRSSIPSNKEPSKTVKNKNYSSS